MPRILCQLHPMREISGALMVFPSASRLVQRPWRPGVIILKKPGALSRFRRSRYSSIAVAIHLGISSRTGDPHLYITRHHFCLVYFGACLQFSSGSYCTLKLGNGILCIAAARRIEILVFLIQFCEWFLLGYGTVIMVLRFAE